MPKKKKKKRTQEPQQPIPVTPWPKPGEPWPKAPKAASWLLSFVWVTLRAGKRTW